MAGCIMKYPTIGHRLPGVIARPLFGDRERFGPVPDADDASWQEWMERGTDFYLANQRTSIGLMVNRAGYRIVKRVDLADRDVMEIGPGAIEHVGHWRGRPRRWINYDIREDMLRIAGQRIEETGVPHAEILAEPKAAVLPFADASFDVILSFYVLEHIYPLAAHVDEVVRILRPNGILAGAIPCEGGLAWGLGRFLTSRRWLLRNTSIDPNRLICWEHPNFADAVLSKLDRRIRRQRLRFWPLGIPLVDANLVASFIYRKV
jgi:SAM-dependent methyltransferase